jgi:signal transduction histidine kinase
VLGYHFLSHDLRSPWWQSVPSVAISWAFLTAGLVGLIRRPENRLGWLMLLVAFALLLRKFEYSGNSATFTFGFAVGQLFVPAFAHAVLGFPSGRLVGRLENRLVVAAYGVALVMPITSLLFYDPARSCVFRCGHRDRVRPDSLLLVDADKPVFHALNIATQVALYGVLATLFIGLIVRKVARETPRARRLRAPLAIAGVAAGLRAISQLVFAFVAHGTVVGVILFAAEEIVQIAVPAALLVGILRGALARASVADLVRDLERTPPAEVEAMLARTLHDRSLRVGFWVPDRRSYVDAAGQPFEPPHGDQRRAVTELGDANERIAVLVYDPAIREQEGSLVDAVCAAARLALGNARLHAELRAQLAKVRESRARLVAAADDERRRIERDLHDGAQQRLVALALDLRVAQRRLDGAGGEVADVLAHAVDSLQGAIEELRELARGVHPAILSEEGLGPALRSLAARASLPVQVVAAPERRLPQELESAAYFVAAEALTNALKHESATSVTIGARQENGTLLVEVFDDGAGGADASKGTGLRGLVDRVEAHGGRLFVESRAGHGTKVTGELPCVW